VVAKRGATGIMGQVDDLKRSFVMADSTLRHLRAIGVPAHPRNFELLFTYVSGSNPALNRSIDKILRSNGSISADDIETIFNEFLADDHIGQKIEEIGDRIDDEIVQAINLLSESSETSKRFSATLVQTRNDLEHQPSAAGVDGIVRRLSDATGEADAATRKLTNQLDEARRHIAELQQSLEMVRFESLTDDLTTLSNRKHFDRSINRLVREGEDLAREFALLMVDIDHFKAFNDTFGHQTGDQVLRLVALSIKQTLTSQDIACRYGGEEFALLLPASSLEHAILVAEQIRCAVMTKELVKRSTGENLGRITISLGVAIWHDGDAAADVIARADRALYAAKRNGRNLVCDETQLEGLLAGDKVA
jgi:diguanylate cyclase